jgi:hypothetical protein
MKVGVASGFGTTQNSRRERGWREVASSCIIIDDDISGGKTTAVSRADPRAGQTKVRRLTVSRPRGLFLESFPESRSSIIDPRQTSLHHDDDHIHAE